MTELSQDLEQNAIAEADEQPSATKKGKNKAKQKDKTGDLDTNMLAFERSLQFSEALMFGEGQDDKKVPVVVFQKGIRGMTGSYFDTEAKRTKSAGNSNIQMADAAILPAGCDTLRIEFLMRVLPNSRKPSASDDAKVTKRYEELSSLFAEKDGYYALAERYVWNLVNGRISWRNGFQTDDAKIDISWGQSEEDKLSLNIKDAIGRKTPLTSGQIASIHGVAANEEPEVLATRLNDLARAIADALSGDRTPLNVKVVWRGKMEPGQEVFPSQEYVRGEKTDDNHKKILAKIPVNGVDQASIHSQKIAAAVAHIDDWHDHKDEYGVIMVHPYGAIYGLNTGLRMQESFYEKRQDYERLIQNWDDLLFVMANLVRGGVLGKKVD